MEDGYLFWGSGLAGRAAPAFGDVFFNEEWQLACVNSASLFAHEIFTSPGLQAAGIAINGAVGLFGADRVRTIPPAGGLFSSDFCLFSSTTF